MSRKLRMPGLLLLLLVLGACGKDGSPTDPGGDGTVSGDPTTNGGWPNPDGTIPVIQPVDPSYTPGGTGSAGTDGTGTTLVMQTSGAARYNLGTCGKGGTWTDPLGNKYGPNNPNCLAYKSDGSVGANNKGSCVTSPEGYAGLWLNPQDHPTSPYSSQCLQLGPPSSVLALSFPAQAELFTATDGSGGSVLNFTRNGTVEAQLIYHGTTDGTTTGAGVLLGEDNVVAGRIWSIGFSQPALNYAGGFANGDVISLLSDPGVQVVGCNTVAGCVLITLQLAGF
jgi:hypothetical protein